MASPLPQTDGSRHAPLHTNRFMTGLWTNRNELRDAATPYLYEKFYSATHYDSLIGGLNAELTPKMTMARRAGHTIYNSQTFPRVNRFASFRTFSTSTEAIRVMADCAGEVYDATGPDTKLNIWNKLPGALDSTFQSVGNILFWGDGVSQKKWVQTTLAWEPLTEFDAGDQIVDSNNNLQVVLPQSTATVASIEVRVVSGVSSLYITLNGPNPFAPGANVGFANVTTATWLNGATVSVTGSAGPTQFTATTTHGAYAVTADTGTAMSTNAASGGISGSSVIWNATLGNVTVDGTLEWICKGSSVQNWGIQAGTAAPTVNQAALPSPYPAWAASTVYFPSLLIVDTNNNIQLLTTGGTTGAAEPTWNVTVGGTTTDGSGMTAAVWTNQGPAGWLPDTVYAVGAKVAVSFTYYITIQVPDNSGPIEEDGGGGGDGVGGTRTITVPVTANDYFQCTVAGTSGGTAPGWVDGIGSQVTDGTAPTAITWTNVGTFGTWTSTVGAMQAVSTAQTILDANGYLQQILTGGKSGTMVPTWSQTPGATTLDGTAVWTNGGAYAAAFTAPVTYAYAYTSSTSFHTGTASPQSAPIQRSADMRVNVQGPGSTDPQVDTITIYRTAQGGSTLLFIGQIAAPAAGAMWTFSDTSSDQQLNEELPAAIADSNDPPPTGFRPLAYHLSRIFGAIDNTLMWTNGTNQTGDPNQSFDPDNFFVYPAKIIRAWACTLGLIVYTVSEVYIVYGSGTSSDPLFTQKYVDGLGILSYDAFTVNKTTPYVMTSIKQVMAMDPSSGLIEPGFPIADQFDTLFDPTTVQMAWHEGSHGDTALYVGDGIDSWFRMAALSAPESGLVWSTKATLASGYSAMGSIETTPGQKQLLFGPATSGPILFRDTTVNTDNTALFAWYPIIGSVVLAQPGQIAEISFLTLESVRTGTRPTVGVLLGEIGGATSTAFETLFRTRQDPVNLPPSTSLYNDRYYMMQNQKTILCRHLQIRFDFAAEDAYNELLTYTIYGALQNTK
jgi:hypothetical protein